VGKKDDEKKGFGERRSSVGYRRSSGTKTCAMQ
jgi:hypothetical protein